MRAMFSLMHLTAHANGLAVSYHAAVGVTLIALAVALFVVLLSRRTPARRRWAMSAAVLVAGWSGLYFSTFQATLTPQSATVYAFLRYDDVLSWKDAAEVYLDDARGGDAQIVLVDRSRRALELNVADLSPADRARMLSYMRSQLAAKQQHTPAALERRPTRRPDLFSDQQI